MLELCRGLLTAVGGCDRGGGLLMGKMAFLYAVLVLLVNAVSPSLSQTVTVQDASLSVLLGQRQDLNCIVTGQGSAALEYEWVRLRDGATVRMRSLSASVHSISSVTAEDASVYECRVFMAGSDSPVAVGSVSLNVSIPAFQMRFSFGGDLYVGQNASFVCQTLFPENLAGLTADVEIFGPDDSRIERDGRVSATETEPLANDFASTLQFASLSAEDRGVYSCTGTIRPITPNPLVSNSSAARNRELSVFDLDLSAELSPVTGRFLDVAPYNSFQLTCSASVTTVRSLPISRSIRFSWFRAVNSSAPSNLTENVTNAVVFGSMASSVLSVVTEQAGNHTYTCRVRLDIAPAPDIIMDEDLILLEVGGPTSPRPPLDPIVVADSLSSNSATIQWRVEEVQYVPEVYRVLYGTAQDNLTFISAEVSSGNDITLTDFNLSVQLVGLEVRTIYFFAVEAKNTVGVEQSPVRSFMTTDLPPTPPRNFVSSRDADVPTTFRFSWTPPEDIRGDLSRYELTCQPVEGEAPVITMPFEPSTTEATVRGLVYRVTYNCSVRARNMAYSQPSNVETITVTETAPGIVGCGEGWDVMPTGSEGVDVTVQWSQPTNPNGITLGYTLNFVSFTGGTHLGTANVSASSTSFTFSNLILRAGVPYNVSIVAVNAAGVSSEVCFQTDFSDQQVPAGPVPGLRLTRSESGTSIMVAWRVLTLVEAMGFLEYQVQFQPTTSTGGRSKRQDGATCSQSPCRVGVERGGVNITGLDPGVEYSVAVTPVNAEGEAGQVSNMTVTGVASSTPQPDTFPLLPVIVGVVLGVLVIGIIIVICCIVMLCCCVRGRNKQYSVPGRIEMDQRENKQDYVNDTVLCDQQAPLYTPVPVKDRLKAVPVGQFPYHVQDMHANRDGKFEMEYESLGIEKLASCEIAQLNKAKNRFANIFPYDFSRVKLSLIEKQEGSDYINASYIDGYKQANAYIAAQGPMPNTIGDFWRMIWEHKLTAVVMLTKVNEAGKKKCEQYWPDAVGQTVVQPGTTLEVTLKELIPYADYEIRKLEVLDVSPECTEVPLPVVQYHFLGWPDHGVPKFATSLIEFIRRVRHSYKSEQPILVHCGAGVGRTGTYITLDAMLERMKEMDNINVYEFVRNMRAKRVLMVQTQAQYVFIHDALEELITCGETSISAPSLRDAINALNKVNPHTHNRYFEEQFQLLNKVSRVPTDSDLSDALQHYNEHKNRYQTRVPYNTNRVRLRPTGTAGAEYINASLVDGYKHRNAYIATQGPLEGTVHEFWRMIWEFKSKVIVMLCQTEEEGKESCYQYWPEREGGEMVLGKLLVTLQSEKVGKEYVERKLEIKEPNAEGTPGQGFVVTQLHYQQWPEHDRPSKSVGLLKVIKSLNNAQRNTGNKPVTVMCNDGVGRTGSFICVHAMLERVNTENIVDFFQFIKSSRIHRPSMVLELEHYRFCHDALADYLNTLDSYANFKDLS